MIRANRFARIARATGRTPECTKIARFSAVAAANFTAPPQNRAIFKAPRRAISSAKKIASERRFSLRFKGTNLIPTAEIPAIPESAAKIASERRCAILVHSGVHRCKTFFFLVVAGLSSIQDPSTSFHDRVWPIQAWIKEPRKPKSGIWLLFQGRFAEATLRGKLKYYYLGHLPLAHFWKISKVVPELLFDGQGRSSWLLMTIFAERNFSCNHGLHLHLTYHHPKIRQKEKETNFNAYRNIWRLSLGKNVGQFVCLWGGVVTSRNQSTKK